MIQKKNRGVSIVEVLIALAISLIMMLPIVNSLISSMKSTSNAKELQNRNEYAQNLMENVIEIPNDVLN